MPTWLKRLWAYFFKKPTPRVAYRPVDDRIEDCILWMQQNPTGKHYVACRLLSTAQDLQKQFPTATVLTIQRLATGWCTNDENAFLCCTSTLLNGPVARQLNGRLRSANAESHTLIFVRGQS